MTAPRSWALADGEIEPAEAVARGLALTIELRDTATGEHCRQVGDLCGETALQLGHDEQDARLLVLAGRLHDLGKIGVPDRVLRNRDELKPTQLSVIRAHAENGERILLEMSAVSEELIAIARIVGAHHERWNGKGYPRGLAGNGIPRGARILAVADAYSAMTLDRSYQPALSHEQAIEEIRAGAGTHFDPEVVEAFLALDWAARIG